MGYEHQQEVNAIADNVVKALVQLTDDVPDKDQAALLFSEAASIVAGVITTIGAEQKKEYKLKVIAEIGLAVTKRALNIYLPDRES